MNPRISTRFDGGYYAARHDTVKTGPGRGRARYGRARRCRGSPREHRRGPPPQGADRRGTQNGHTEHRCAPYRHVRDRLVYRPRASIGRRRHRRAVDDFESTISVSGGVASVAGERTDPRVHGAFSGGMQVGGAAAETLATPGDRLRFGSCPKPATQARCNGLTPSGEWGALITAACGCPAQGHDGGTRARSSSAVSKPSTRLPT